MAESKKPQVLVYDYGPIKKVRFTVDEEIYNEFNEAFPTAKDRRVHFSLAMKLYLGLYRNNKIAVLVRPRKGTKKTDAKDNN